jgi:hypothetical protein
MEHESWKWVLTKRYIFLPTTVVEAPTSFGGTSPEVFLQKVVRSYMEWSMADEGRSRQLLI